MTTISPISNETLIALQPPTTTSNDLQEKVQTVFEENVPILEPSSSPSLEGKISPNLHAIILVVLDATTRVQMEVLGYTQEATSLQDTMAKLIDLKGKLSFSSTDQEFLTLTKDVHDLCRTLQDAGFESLLQNGESKVSRERTMEVKAHIDSHLERIKTNLQTLFTTKIQVRVSEMNALLECLKTLEKYIDKLMSTIVQNQAKR